jgi:glutaredoxin
MSQFAKCLTEKGAVFYGTEWCPHCNNQKAMFGDAMKNINFIDCDKESQACTTAGIEGYPTRVFKDGSKTPGTQEFAALAAKTGCEVPQS